MRPRGRLLTTVVGTLLVLGSATGCQGTPDVVPGDDWHPDSQFAPSLRPAFGARVTDGTLQIWTGSPCVGVTRLAVNFDVGTGSLTQAVFTAAPSGATVERFTVAAGPAGMAVKQALPAAFDPAAAATAELSLYGPAATWGTSVDLAQVRAGSPSHPSDTYFFEKVGWLNTAQVAAQDGKTFLATCTRDPNKG